MDDENKNNNENLKTELTDAIITYLNRLIPKNNREDSRKLFNDFPSTDLLHIQQMQRSDSSGLIRQRSQSDSLFADTSRSESDISTITLPSGLASEQAPAPAPAPAPAQAQAQAQAPTPAPAQAQAPTPAPENGFPKFLNIIIGKYVYRVVMEKADKTRFIMTESFVDNASGKRYLHLLAITKNPPPEKIKIDYLAKSGENGTSLMVVSPETVRPVLPDIEGADNKYLIEQADLVERNNTELTPETISQIRLAEQKKGVVFYIPTEPYNTEQTIPECEKIFDRKNLSLVYRYLPEFIEKYIRYISSE